MNRIVYFLFILSCALVLGACTNEFDAPYYPRLNQFHCYYRSGWDYPYIVRINIDIGEDEFFSTHNYNFNQSFETKLTEIEMIRSNAMFYLPTSNLENYLIENNRILIGWETKNGELISEENPLIINFHECHETPIVIYARTQGVSPFYSYTEGTNVSDELANLAHIGDVESMIEYIDSKELSPYEIRTILSTLISVRSNPKQIRTNSIPLPQVMNEFEDLFIHYDDLFFNFVRYVNERIEQKLGLSTDFFRQSFEVSLLPWQYINRESRTINIYVSYTYSERDDLIISVREGFSSYIEKGCNQNVTNCVRQTPSSYSTSTWYSSSSQVPIAPSNDILRSNPLRIELWTIISDSWINLVLNPNQE